MSLVQPTLSPDALARRFVEVRARSLRLANSLSPEDQQIQAFDYASPTKWHLAHTTWFFETFVLGVDPHYRPFDPSFAVLFNSYYEGVGERFARARRGLLSRPDLATVHAYRDHVDQAVVEALATSRGEDHEVARLVELGLHHEMQHQELALTDILANLSVNPTLPAWRDEPVELGREPAASRWIAFDEQLTEIGCDGGEFCFDNETPRHRSFVHAFALRDTPVTNAEVMAFIADDGYARAELWLSDGIAWVREHAVEAPAYWVRDHNHGWRTFTLYGERAIDPHAPATHLSGYEADAIATWLGARLPTEHEWELAANTRGDTPQCGRWLEHGPVVPRLASGHGAFTSLWGETWEWTRSAYRAYPGFRPLPGAVGEYNGKFMSNQWVLRGGSCATPPGHARATYRNFFYPDQRWQFTGLRPARDLA